MKYRLRLVALFGLVCHVLSEQCVKIPSRNCDCRTSKHTLSLEEYTYKPFLNIPDSKKPPDFYSYNPCAPLNCPIECASGANDTAAVWQCIKLPANACYYTGDFKYSMFHGDPENGDLLIEYRGESNRRTYVKLVCSTDARLEVIGETQHLIHNLTLYTPLVCVQGVLPHTTPQPNLHEGLSTGSILLIMFFVLGLVYLVGGMLYLRFKHGARGVEMIPNYDFWAELPGLVKDGAVFVSRGCKNEPTYQQI